MYGCSYTGSLAYYEELNGRPVAISAGKTVPVNKKTASNTALLGKTSGAKALSHVKREGYAIQVGAFKNAGNAGRLADALGAKGFDAFLFKENGVYKVRFGNYKSRDEARAKGRSLKAQGKISEFFVVAPEDYAVSKAVKIDFSGSAGYLRKEITKAAHQYIGVPYIWGGTSEAGFDCSGLTRAVYRLNGISIPRVSRDQFKSGKAVKKRNLKPGDLVFFATSGGRRVSHVGVYIGGGQFIHAPSKGKTVRKADLNSSYWIKRYMGARSYL